MDFYRLSRKAVKLYYSLFYRIKTEGAENIPQGENFIVCANHKSLNDPPLLGAFLPIDLKFMGKEELFSNKLFAKVLYSMGAFPVKRGKGDIGALKAAIRILSEGENLMIFPEGARSPKGHMHQGKAGAMLIAVKSRVNILPVGISGGYRPFSKIVIKIGKPIRLDEYFGTRCDTETLQGITDNQLMPAIASLAGVPTYENRDCR